MNDHNLDDLIIDNINPKNAKRKSLLTIIALAIVVLIVAIILTKTLLKEPNNRLAINEENVSEMISPDLTLQNAIKEEDTQEELSLKSKPLVISPKESPSESSTLSSEKDLSKSSTIDTPLQEKEEIVTETPAEKTKPKTVAISEDIFEDDIEINDKAEKEQEKKLALAKAKKEATQKAAEKKAMEKKESENKAAQNKASAAKKRAKAKELASKIKVTQKIKTKPVTKPKKTSTSTQQSGHYYIQVGSFKQSPSKKFLSIIQKSGFNYRITSPSSSGTKKLLIGPYSSRGSVDSALPRVRDRINKGAFVVKK
jgi:DedD protein